MNKRRYKKTLKHIHWPGKHELAVQSSKLLHDSRFWIVTGFFLFVILLIILALLLGGDKAVSEYPLRPFNFYGPYF